MSFSNDLCSTESPLTLAFHDLEPAENHDDFNYEPGEYKYDPDIVKDEIPDDKGGATEAFSDDEFIKDCGAKKPADGQDRPHPQKKLRKNTGRRTGGVPKKKSKPCPKSKKTLVATRPVRQCTRQVRVKEEVDFYFEDDEQYNVHDDDFDPADGEDDDEKKAKKRKPVKRKEGRRKPGRRSRAEQEALECEEELKALEALLDEDKTDPGDYGEESLLDPEVEKGWNFITLPDGTKRKKRISEMTTEEQIVLRNQWRRQKQRRQQRLKEFDLESTEKSKDSVTKSVYKRMPKMGGMSVKKKMVSEVTSEEHSVVREIWRKQFRLSFVTDKTIRRKLRNIEFSDGEADTLKESDEEMAIYERLDDSSRTRKDFSNFSVEEQGFIKTMWKHHVLDRRKKQDESSCKVKVFKVMSNGDINEKEISEMTLEEQEYVQRKWSEHDRLIFEEEARHRLSDLEFSDGELRESEKSSVPLEDAIKKISIYEKMPDGTREKKTLNDFGLEDQVIVRTKWLQKENRSDKCDISEAIPKKEHLDDDNIHVGISIEVDGMHKPIGEMTPSERDYMVSKWNLRIRRKGSGKRKQTKNEIDDEAEDGEKLSFSVRLPDGSRRKKRISEMTPAEQERIRAQWREKRKRERDRNREIRALLKSEGDSSDGHDAKTGPTALGGRRKKRVSEMTPEELEAIRQKWREQRERKKQRRAQKTPEQLERDRQKAVERTRLRRALAKAGALTPEQMAKVEEQYRKDRERKAARRAAMSKEEKREEAKKFYEWRRKKTKELSEEEKRERRMNEYMKHVARLASMTTEEREKRRLKKLEASRKRYARLKEQIGIDGIREMRRNYWHTMTPERKEAALAKLREGYKKRIDKLKEDPEKYEEIRKKWYDRDQIYKQRKREKKGITTPVVRRIRKKNLNCTPEELTEMERSKRREYHRKSRLRQRLRTQQLLESGMTLEEIHRQRETPEQRERRVLRARVNKAKSQLRKNLSQQGAAPEEIEKRVEELSQNFQVPTTPVRPYKAQNATAQRIASETIVVPEIGVEADVKPPVKKRSVKSKEAISSPAQALPSNQVTPKKRGRPPTKKVEVPAQPPVLSATTTGVIISREPPSQSRALAQTIQLHQSVPLTQPSPVATVTTLYPTNSFNQQQFHIQQYTHSSQPQVIYSYQSQQIQPVTQSFSLQHILDGVQYHETFNQSLTIAAAAPVTQYTQHDQSTTSSQHEYGSSYYDDDNDRKSGPVSPACESFDAYSNYSYIQSEVSTQQIFASQPPIPHSQPEPSPHKKSKTGTTEPVAASDTERRGPKGGKIRPGRKYVYRPPKNPNAKTRTKQKDVIRDVVCDQCGQGFNRLSLRAHKNQLHNPNYDLVTRTCKICGEHHRLAQYWYKHYLNAHVRPNEVPVLAKHVCEECGKSFSQKGNMEKHYYYQHGEGRAKENYIKCHLCPDDKFFKEKLSWYSHCKRVHPDYQRGGHDCARCTASFGNEKLLKEHIQEFHPESFFPCKWCTCVRYTDMALRFHHTRCTKIPKEQKMEYMKRKTEYYPESYLIPCELCKKTFITSSLSRHYKEMHNVIEDEFKCFHCEKKFRIRGFWMVHMEEIHCQKLETFYDKLGLLNASNREGMSVEPVRTRGNPYGCKSRVTNCSDDELTDGRKGPRRRRRRLSFDEDSDTKSEGKVKRKRRKIQVIAEEEEMEFRY